MKVLLIKDVYKLGRAGDVKRVADGYGRNFLLPQGLAVLATPGALARTEHIRAQANEKRAILNNELGGVAEILSKLTLTFPAKAGETGKLYGSITPVMICDAIKGQSGIEVNRRQLDFEPIRTLGTHKTRIRMTIDLIPEVTVIVYREGESVGLLQADAEAEVEPESLVEMPQAETKPEIEPETKPEIEPETKPETEPETEPGTEPGTEPETV
jgi:large subunit ribosomal protein L9